MLLRIWTSKDFFSFYSYNWFCRSFRNDVNLRQPHAPKVPHDTSTLNYISLGAVVFAMC